MDMRLDKVCKTPLARRNRGFPTPQQRGAARLVLIRQLVISTHQGQADKACLSSPIEHQMWTFTVSQFVSMPTSKLYAADCLLQYIPALSWISTGVVFPGCHHRLKPGWQASGGGPSQWWYNSVVYYCPGVGWGGGLDCYFTCFSCYFIHF